MKIKDLSPELRELAVKNTLNPECSDHGGQEYATEDFALNSALIQAFRFRYSPEGRDFWWHVLGNGTAPKNHPLYSKETKIE